VRLINSLEISSRLLWVTLVEKVKPHTRVFRPHVISPTLTAVVPGITPLHMSISPLHSPPDGSYSMPTKKALLLTAETALFTLMHLPEIALAAAENLPLMECTVSVFEEGDVQKVLPESVPVRRYVRNSVFPLVDGQVTFVSYARADGLLAVVHLQSLPFAREPVEEFHTTVARGSWHGPGYDVRTPQDVPELLLPAAVDVLTYHYVTPDRCEDTNVPFTLLACPLMGAPCCLRGCPHECENRREELPYYDMVQEIVTRHITSRCPFMGEVLQP